MNEFYEVVQKNSRKNVKLQETDVGIIIGNIDYKPWLLVWPGSNNGTFEKSSNLTV